MAVEGDVVLRDVGGRAEVDHGRRQRLDLLVLHLVHGVGQHLAVHLVADGRDVAGLLGAEDVARPADLQVAHGDPEARAEVRVFLDGLEPLGGDGRDRPCVRQEQVGVGPVLVPPDAAAKLVQLGQAEAVGVVDEDRVGVGDVQARLDDRRADQHVGSCRG